LNKFIIITKQNYSDILKLTMKFHDNYLKYLETWFW
jgi:hypothetical protein